MEDKLYSRSSSSTTSPFCLALIHICVREPGSDKSYRTETNTMKKEAKGDCYDKIITDKAKKKKKNESLAPLVLINSSFKRTSVFRFRVFDWLSNLHNRVKHLCTRVFCLYMCYVLMGQESLFHLANNDNYDAELIGKIFKMIILLRFERTF